MSSCFIAHGIKKTWDNHHLGSLSVTGIWLQFCSVVVVLMIPRVGSRILQDIFHLPFFWLFDNWQSDGTAGSTLSDNGLGGTCLA